MKKKRQGVDKLSINNKFAADFALSSPNFGYYENHVFKKQFYQVRGPLGKLYLILISFLLPLFIMNQAIAQDEELALEEIIVSAEKKEADLQDVPIPITALSKIDIEDRGIDNFDNLTGTIPNLQFISSARPGGGSFNFRGIGMFGMSVISEKSPVVVNFDGIPWEGRFSLLSSFDDIETIEFLRSPQGTLYGKNSMGGVLNITTVKPGEEFHGKVGLSIEGNNTYGTNAHIQGPIVGDKLLFYLSGAWDKTDGLLTDHTKGGQEDWDHEEKEQLLTKLVYKPTDRFNAILQYGYGNVDGGNAPWISSKKIIYDTNKGFMDPDFNTCSHDAALKMHYDFGSMELTSLSTMRMTHTDSNQYFGLPTSSGFDDIDEDIFSQEIRITSNNAPGELNWIGGLFYSRENMERSRTGYNYDMRDIGYGFITYDYPTKIDSDIYAVFGQISIPVLSEKLTFTLGSRYEYVDRYMNHNYKESDYISGMLYTQSAYSIDDSWDTLLGKAALSWHFQEELMAYASISQGYTAGGFNYLENNPEYATFNEQKSLDYELGMKAMLWDKKLMLNPNIFYIKYNDLQISEEVESMKYVVVNAGKAHAKGIEIDWRARLSSYLSIYGSLGIIQAEYDDYEDYGGNKMVHTPNYTVDVGATYRNTSGFFASFDLKCYGKNHTTSDNSPEFTQDTLKLVNGKIGWEFTSGLETYLYVSNLFDEEYFSETSQEYGMYMVGKPRTFGMQLTYRF